MITDKLKVSLAIYMKVQTDFINGFWVFESRSLQYSKI